MTIEAIQIGDAAACELVITAADVDQFARLSQDTNPLHVDAGAAHAFGFPAPVAHGMLALSSISRLIGTELPGPGALWMSQEVRFIAPVLVGDALRARVEVQQVSRGSRVVVLRTEVVNRDSGRPVLSGTAKVMLLAPIAADMRRSAS
jgi:acyl dehydratase